MIDKDRLLASFLEMVKIASPSRKEGIFAAYLQKQMEDMGLEVIIDEQSREKSGSDSGNLIGRLKGNKPGVAPVLFSAHMDTVSPGERIEPLERDGVIFSKGATILGADDKSGIAAILEAIRHLQEEGIAHGDIEVLFTVGEEMGLLGARYLNFALLTAKMGYILDCGGNPGLIINQGPAHDTIKAVINGRSAHAGANPEEGISAIQVAARAIDRMNLLRIDKETTANIGRISGGNATNIVCDRVELEGEARSLLVNKLDRQTKEMVNCLEQAGREFGARVEIEVNRSYPAFHVAEDHPVIEMAKAAATKIGLKAEVSATGGGSDVHFLNEGGLQAVNLATGMNKVHTTDEQILIGDLVDTARFVAAIVEVIGESSR